MISLLLAVSMSRLLVSGLLRLARLQAFLFLVHFMPFIVIEELIKASPKFLQNPGVLGGTPGDIWGVTLCGTSTP